MAPRKRSRGRENWPDNLTAHTDKKTGRTYFSFLHPHTKKRVGFGTDKAAAFAAARQVNERLQGENPLVAKVFGEITVEVARQKFEEEYLAGRDYAESHLYNTKLYIKHFAEQYGEYAVRSLKVNDVSRHLDGFSNRASNARRNALLHFFRYCVSKGWCDTNLAEITLPKTEEVQRQRIKSMSVFKQIWLKASPPIRNAMDLSLKTLQARREISEMKFEKYNKDTRKLRIVRHKTRRASIKRFLRGLEPVAFIEITADDELHAIIERCRDDIVSAYMVHQVVDRNDRRAKGLSPESISRGFSAARDATGLFDKVPPKKRPTFHEIRSLGADLLRKKLIANGMNADDAEAFVQRLLGHTDSAMTKKYLDGHDIPFVEVTL